jgi:pyruvate dehydrogenase E2 component (dihydrolipoamide acetyltransferase)
MATKVVMEALSPTMEEGRLVEWKKAEGEAVSPGDVLAEVETDKAVMELVARAGGTLLRQAVSAGATVPVSAVVGWIGEAGEVIPDGSEAGGRQGGGDGQVGGQAGGQAGWLAGGREGGSVEAAVERAGGQEGRQVEAAVALPPGPGGRVKASPLARKIAAEKGVDLTTVVGSGPEGRVIRRDLDSTTAARPSARPAVRPAAGTPSLPPFSDIPLTQIRKTIAKRLAQSIGPIPTFYLTSEIDMERAADLRDQLKATQGEELRVSFNDLVVRAVALALRKHPACNAWWQDDHIRQWNEVHVGMAVAIPDGLITPVIRHADRKSLIEIGAESRELAARARDRRLKPEEYTGATFSVSNLGMFEIEHFTAVINPPEAGILAVGSIGRVPVAVEDRIIPRRRMRVTMSCDHRVIDGATGAQFLSTVKLLLENPTALVW